MAETKTIAPDAPFDERLDHAERIIQSELGDQNFLAIVPGTGWKQGLEGIFKKEQEIPYSQMAVPGADHNVEGHSKSMDIGSINGRDAIMLGRVHANEDPRAHDLQRAMLLLINAVRNNVDGVIITNAAGTLHGRINEERGLVRSLIDTSIADLMGSALRGRSKEPLSVGDIAVLDQISTLSLGANTPLGAGDFVDYSSANANHGLHGYDDFPFEMARRSVGSAQKGRAPRANYYYIPGPQFEGPWDKRIMRALGGDAVGMSSIQGVLASTQAQLPMAGLTFITNPAFGTHSHQENLAVAEKNAPKMGRVMEDLADRWPTIEQIQRAS